MNDIDIETILYEALQDEDEFPEVTNVRTFNEAALLTRNRGVVITTEDGSQFELTIVQRR